MGTPAAHGQDAAEPGPLTEAGGLIILSILQTAVVLLFPAVLIYAALCDLAAYRIPNWLSLVLIAGFLIAALLSGMGWEAFFWRLGAGLAMLAFGVVLFATGIMGGGDVKIMASAALWTGWGLLPAFLFVVAVAGGLVALALLILRKSPFSGRLRALPKVGHLFSPEEGVPYGVGIAVAGVIIFLKASQNEVLFFLPLL